MNIIQLYRNAKRLIPSLTGKGTTIVQTENSDDVIFQSRIWYGGNPEELMQLYSSGNRPMRFWGCRPSYGDIRRIHVGIPAATVNKLAEISAMGYKSTTVEDESMQDFVDDVIGTNNLKIQLESITKDVLLYGFGAWKVFFSEDGDIRFRWYTYPDVDIIAKEKEVKRVVFKTPIKEGKYVVYETYEEGKINVECRTESGSVVDDAFAPEEYKKAKLQECEWDGHFSLAVPVIYAWSSRFKDSTEGIMASKFDAYDFLDECASKLVEHLRDGQIKTYIPSSMVIQGQNPNNFDNKYIKMQPQMGQNATNDIDRESEQLQVDAYVKAYLMALDLALQGIISPSTLGIDTQKTENAEAQREKEKTTIYSRGKIINILSMGINDLVRTILLAHATASGTYKSSMETICVSSDFDDYITPDFTSVIDTINKAGDLMSIEAKVEELWGDSKTDDWKKAEVARIKAERGLIPVDDMGMIDYDV